MMRIAKWGNSLAVPIPAVVINAMKLKEDDEIEIRATGAFEFARKPGATELLGRLRKFRGRLPADFRFDRLDAYKRG